MTRRGICRLFRAVSKNEDEKLQFANRKHLCIGESNDNDIFLCRVGLDYVIHSVIEKTVYHCGVNGFRQLLEKVKEKCQPVCSECDDDILSLCVSSLELYFSCSYIYDHVRRCILHMFPRSVYGSMFIPFIHSFENVRGTLACSYHQFFKTWYYFSK